MSCLSRQFCQLDYKIIEQRRWLARELNTLNAFVIIVIAVVSGGADVVVVVAV